MLSTILMPALSPTMEKGHLSKWHVKEGDVISSGDVIAEIETDKATMEVEAVDDGIIAKILVPDGTADVAVNSIIAVLKEEGDHDDVDAFIKAQMAGSSQVATVETPKANVDTTVISAASSSLSVPTLSTAQPVSSAHGRIFASPLARRIAKDNGLDISLVKGSGPRGRIVRGDVEKALAGGVTQTAKAAPQRAKAGNGFSGFEPSYDTVNITTMRRVIADRLTESKQNIPHFYLNMDVCLDKLLEFRGMLNKDSNGSYKISVNDMVIKATAVALKLVPAANSAWSDEGVRVYNRADVSVAVAIEGGLITPVIRDAANKGLKDISSEMKKLASLARDGKLMPEQYQGGTFSISNLGMYGITSFSAVINPPQACILAIGAGREQAVVKDGQIGVSQVMTVTLSVDHRAVDGAVGAEFLAAFKKVVENPVSLLL